MRFGISQKSMGLILHALGQFREIERAAVFGSRAMGSYRNGSDIDLVIYGPRIKRSTVDRLRVMLNEELPLVYYFDVVHYDALQDEPIKDHIDNHAQVFYEAHGAVSAGN